MPGNQRPGPVSGTVCWEDPRDKVKARLPESQSPLDVKDPSTGKALKPVPSPAGPLKCRPCNLWGSGRFPVRELKEMSGTPTSC